MQTHDIRIGGTLTERQEQARRVLNGPAKHVLLRGGSRSGKTFLICRNILIRALKAPESTHVILRHRFNHLKMSVIQDTMPAVLKACAPGMPVKLDKTDWYHELPNESKILYGGLDDKERTEKILGQEHSTIYLNEASQISYTARNMALTRLAQKSGLALKEYADCNPPNVGHWTYRLWFKNVEPKSGAALNRPELYDTFQINPRDNMANLSPDYLETLEGLPEKERRRFLDGEFLAQVENALWTYDLLDARRVAKKDLPLMRRIVVAVDPSGCEGPEDTRSDMIGIIVAGLGADGVAYLLEDLTCHAGPKGWAQKTVDAFDRHGADNIVAEKNYGGAMVQSTIRSVRANAPVKLVNASRGKHVRAEPIASLYEQGKVKHVDAFPDLESEYCNFSTAGYEGSQSPNRADAAIWALTELCIQVAPSTAQFSSYGNH